jgi:hypothetical protein
VKRAALAASLASALLWPALAHAEMVPGSQGATDATLAVAPDGTPRVAFVLGDGSLRILSRSGDGIWTSAAVSGLPGPRVVIVSLAVGSGGAATLLAEDAGGRWLALVEQRGGGWRVRTVARAPKRGLLGFGGLALAKNGHPFVAYTYELASHKTWLRLVHETVSGKLVGERVTRDGFPPSEVLPSAAPVVMPSGAVRIVETYDSATIEWSRTQNHKDWIGQFLYGSTLGTPAGIVQAVAAADGSVWSAWTELFPSFDESQLLLALHRNGEQTSVLYHHAYLVSLALTPSGPELAGDDYVDLGGLRTVFAGVVVGADGGELELAGDLEGYAVDAAGGRHYLLLEPDGLEWYQAAVPPAARVALSDSVSGASVALSGSVTGAAGGSVELWRETANGAELAAAVPLAADGSFSYTDTPSSRPVTYRAVYRDPASGLPLASLLRTVVGA